MKSSPCQLSYGYFLLKKASNFISLSSSFYLWIFYIAIYSSTPLHSTYLQRAFSRIKLTSQHRCTLHEFIFVERLIYLYYFISHAGWFHTTCRKHQDHIRLFCLASLGNIWTRNWSAHPNNHWKLHIDHGVFQSRTIHTIVRSIEIVSNETRYSKQSHLIAIKNPLLKFGIHCIFSQLAQNLVDMEIMFLLCKTIILVHKHYKNT